MSLSVFLLIFASCENDIQQVNDLTLKQDSAILSATNVEITYTNNGIRTVLMKSPELRRYVNNVDKPYLEFPQGLKMFFYDKKGDITSTLRANYSIYYEEEGKWIAKYDVEAVNEEGEQLNTEYLIWLRDEETISTDQFVKITTNDGIIYGDDGFVSNQSFTKWEVINGRGVIDIDTDE